MSTKIRYMENSLISHGVKVKVEVRYEPNAGINTEDQTYIFSYFITIFNNNPFSIQLLNRAWMILDSDGSHRVVQGEGVVGLQPIIEPGESFEYSSFCNLQTDMGQMQGVYQMENLDNHARFDVRVPTFIMIAPERLN